MLMIFKCGHFLLPGLTHSAAALWAAAAAAVWLGCKHNLKSPDGGLGGPAGGLQPWDPGGREGRWLSCHLGHAPFFSLSLLHEATSAPGWPHVPNPSGASASHFAQGKGQRLPIVSGVTVR